MSGNVVTRTDSEEKKKKAEEHRQQYADKQKSRSGDTMIISITGENVQSREIFGKAMIPSNGTIQKVSAKLPKIGGALTLKVISELDAHTREDSFQITGGLTTLEEPIEITAGTVLKFSLIFDQQEEFEEIFVTGIIKTN